MNKIIVEIPSCSEHEGYPGNVMRVEMPGNCICGGTRAVKLYRAISYDGSRRLHVDGWENSCGHIDAYLVIRQKIKTGEYTQVPFSTPTTLEERETIKDGKA